LPEWIRVFQAVGIEAARCRFGGARAGDLQDAIAALMRTLPPEAASILKLILKYRS
jgi:hypothetical protein